MITRPTPPRTRSRGSQAGMTLVEMTVVMLLLGLVVGGITAAFLSAQRSVEGIDNRLENIGEAQKLISVTSKDIRTATPLVAGESPFVGPTPPFTATTLAHATKREIIFYAQLNPDPTSCPTPAPTPCNIWLPAKVRLFVDSTDPKVPVLKEEVWEPLNRQVIPPVTTPNYGLPATEKKRLRLVGQYVANDQATQPIFTYFDVDGDVLDPGVAGDATNGNLDPTEQKAVRSIKITLAIRKSTNLAVKPTTVETTVRLPNVIHGNLTAFD